MLNEAKRKQPWAKGLTPRRARNSTSRDEILRAAAEIFMEFGFAATSIDAVAERLGSTKGRIYHHYCSKVVLFIEIQVAAMKRLLNEIEPLARGGGNAMDRLSTMALRHIEIVLTELPMQKVALQGLERHLLGKLMENKRLRSVIKLRDNYETLFAEVIDEGIRAGYFVDQPPRLATKPFFGALNWATIWFNERRLQRPEAVREIGRVLAAFALRGLLKDSNDASIQKPALLCDDLG
jgi:AcrR family transcriptional regulator